MQWFEREFRFPFPVDVSPGILERLRGLVPRVRSKIGDGSTLVWTTRFEDSWSAQENIGHLLDLEELWSGRVTDFLSGVERLRPADLDNRRTHDAEHNTRSLEETVTALQGARDALLEAVEKLTPDDFGRAAEHPRLGQPMRLIDHLYFVAEHDDHHLARVAKILQCYGR